MNNMKMMLANQGNGNGTANVEIIDSGGGLNIYISGYGTKGEAPGFGCPIHLELYDGRLRLHVWADINQEDPSHTILLEGAAESNRHPDKE